jgi:hypothetical protein
MAEIGSRSSPEKGKKMADGGRSMNSDDKFRGARCSVDGENGLGQRGATRER